MTMLREGILLREYLMGGRGGTFPSSRDRAGKIRCPKCDSQLLESYSDGRHTCAVCNSFFVYGVRYGLTPREERSLAKRIAFDNRAARGSKEPKP